MSEPGGELDSLRQEIDRIDERIAMLLAARMEVVSAIRNVKKQQDGGGLALRPGREAQIIKRLVNQTIGAFPKGPLVRIWRELLSTTTRAQSRLKPALVTSLSDNVEAEKRIVGDHFGSQTEFFEAESLEEAIDAVQSGDADLLIVPVPSINDRWRDDLFNKLFLDPAAPASLRVVGRLPFLDDSSSRAYWLLADLPPDLSGDDHALLIIQSRQKPDDLRNLLMENGVEADMLFNLQMPDKSGTGILFEIGGFGPDQMCQIERILTAADKANRILPVGCYPAPLEDN